MIGTYTILIQSSQYNNFNICNDNTYKVPLHNFKWLIQKGRVFVYEENLIPSSCIVIKANSEGTTRGPTLTQLNSKMHLFFSPVWAAVHTNTSFWSPKTELYFENCLQSGEIRKCRLGGVVWTTDNEAFRKHWRQMTCDLFHSPLSTILCACSTIHLGAG